MTLHEYPPHAIRTYSGKTFDLLNPDPKSIDIIDIAHGLSHTPRFGGQTKHFLSVAEHSIKVASLLPEELKIAGLLHDASESYIGDMPSPFKKLMPDFKELEDNLMRIIAMKFGFDYPLHPEIKKADAKALNLEWEMYHLGNDLPVFGTFAKYRFIELFMEFKTL